MPIQEGVQIACKGGVVELTATVVDPDRDDPAAFAESLAACLFDHQYQAMTDPEILDPDDLRIATCVISRDPLPASLKDGLISMGFQAVDTEATGLDEHSIFSRLQKTRRSKLEKWTAMYLRAADVSPRLGELEAVLIEETPRGPLWEVAPEASGALVAAARTTLRLLLAPGQEGLGQLERVLLQERASKRGRVVLHPHAVRAIAAFTAESIILAAPGSRWSEDQEEEAPLWVDAGGGSIVRSDPEFRVVSFMARGGKELLTTYLDSVVRQSRAMPR